MTTIADIHTLAENIWRNGAWYEREAAIAMRDGRSWLIPGRSTDDIYMARFWVIVPPRSPESLVLADGCSLESGNALLLHAIFRPDDDDAMHDHPWNFRTSILSGSYTEQRPTDAWQAGEIDGGPGPELGDVVSRQEGMTMERKATDLHRIASIYPGYNRPAGSPVWTLVRTGPRIRRWGFHPPGKPWSHYREYLGLPPKEATP